MSKNVNKHNVNGILSFASTLYTDLEETAKERQGYKVAPELRIGDSWEYLFKKGEATKKERDAIVEFENALESLSAAIGKIGHLKTVGKD